MLEEEQKTYEECLYSSASIQAIFIKAVDLISFYIFLIECVMKKFIIKFISFFIFPRIRAKNFRKACLKHGFGRFKDSGKNNTVILMYRGKEIPLTWGLAGLDIEINGNDNIVKIGYPYHFEDSVIRIEGDKNHFSIQSCPTGVKKTCFYCARGSTIQIGHNFSVFGTCHFYVGEEEGMTCQIGDDVLFSENIVVRTSDAHTIMNKEGGVINFGKPIILENHIWVCEGVSLLKGTHIVDNTVIGTKSVVTRAFDESGVILGGNPTRIIKREIGWHICSIPDYLEKKQG